MTTETGLVQLVLSNWSGPLDGALMAVGSNYPNSMLPGVQGEHPLKSSHGCIWLQYELGFNLVYCHDPITTMQILMVTDRSNDRQGFISMPLGKLLYGR